MPTDYAELVTEAETLAGKLRRLNAIVTQGVRPKTGSREDAARALGHTGYDAAAKLEQLVTALRTLTTQAEDAAARERAEVAEVEAMTPVVESDVKQRDLRLEWEAIASHEQWDNAMREQVNEKWECWRAALYDHMTKLEAYRAHKEADRG